MMIITNIIEDMKTIAQLKDPLICQCDCATLHVLFLLNEKWQIKIDIPWIRSRKECRMSFEKEDISKYVLYCYHCKRQQIPNRLLPCFDRYSEQFCKRLENGLRQGPFETILHIWPGVLEFTHLSIFCIIPFSSCLEFQVKACYFFGYFCVTFDKYFLWLLSICLFTLPSLAVFILQRNEFHIPKSLS